MHVHLIVNFVLIVYFCIDFSFKLNLFVRSLDFHFIFSVKLLEKSQHLFHLNDKKFLTLNP